nr:unnamed protein product [Digitaria exilis]
MFWSMPVESHTSSKVGGDASYQDAADEPLDNSDCGSEPSRGINAVRKQVKNHKPKKKHVPSKSGPRGRKFPGRVEPPQEDSYHETEFASRDGPSQKGHHDEKNLPYTPFQPFLFQVVLDTPMSALMTVLDKKFMDWIERRNLLKFDECDYACHLDLVARNHGFEDAQKYIERVPTAFRNEVLYETLLVNCVRQEDVKKAQQVFNKIWELSLPLTVSACNQMILLYKRVACVKVADILMLMEQENIKFSRFTYKLLIDLKGRSNDMLGMEQVLNVMKDNGLEPDFATQNMVAKFYISGGLTEKAEEVIRAMEVHASYHREATRSLLGLYAILGRPDDVKRIWNSYTKPKLDDFLAAIEAWGKLGFIEEVEETFEALVKNTSTKLTSKYLNAMLNVYAEHRLLAKGKEFLERMFLKGCPSSPLTWDAIVKLYVNSEKGDIHNSEKIFDRLKQIRYPGRTPPYNVLLAAYANAQATPYGFT